MKFATNLTPLDLINHDVFLEIFPTIFNFWNSNSKNFEPTGW
jgi:hypothetical protein